jgi:hypothetical protein
MAVLDYVLDLMDFDSRFEGRRLGRPPRAIREGLGLEGDL